jgi:hypothetical protein
MLKPLYKLAESTFGHKQANFIKRLLKPLKTAELHLVSF